MCLRGLEKFCQQKQEKYNNLLDMFLGWDDILDGFVAGSLGSWLSANGLDYDAQISVRT